MLNPQDGRSERNHRQRKPIRVGDRTRAKQRPVAEAEDLGDIGTRSWADRIIFRIAESYSAAAMQYLLRHAAAGGSFDTPDDAVQSMDKVSRLVTAANRQVPHIRRYVWFSGV
ncbi:MAG: hypothetical protein JRG89_19945 [Deltaproteobacteria bacterium]|nr:hypothetical protein [Deltaproteobacteria bacterium]MBW2390681.1 hypothetical protein [Deltaproteobacteria bacterium]MBW2725823.1 hypothetical protein [Deltaproteobacteria bacterium]